MVVSIDRENTTKLATKRINELVDDDVISALLLASIYAHMRLRTLITLQLKPPKKHWREIADSFDSGGSILGYGALVSVCNKIGLIDNNDKAQLKKVWKFRNSIAHETTIWKDVTKENKKAMIALCDFVKDFLNRTSN